MIKIDFNTKEVRKVFKNIMKDYPISKNIGLKQAGNALVSVLQEDIEDSSTKTGHTRLFRGRLHTASAPGQTPANMTGNLVKNTTSEVKGSNQVKFGYDEGAGYGQYLELGTQNMDARPGLQNTVNNNMNLIEQKMRASIENSLKKSGAK